MQTKHLNLDIHKFTWAADLMFLFAVILPKILTIWGQTMLKMIFLSLLGKKKCLVLIVAGSVNNSADLLCFLCHKGRKYSGILFFVENRRSFI